MSDANDAHLLELFRLVRLHPAPARAALKRMTDRATAQLAKQTEDKRVAARMEPALLELARQCTLDQSLLEDGAEEFVEGQAGFDPHIARKGRAVPRWMSRARELGLFVDMGTGLHVGNGVAMMNAAAAIGIDIASHTGAECFVLFRRHHAEDSKETEEQIQAAIDPAFVVPVYLPMSCLLFTQLKIELAEAPDARRTQAQWWEVAVALLLFGMPDFDGSSVGLVPPIAWENIPDHPDDGWARCSYQCEIREMQQAHDKLLARTALYLKALEAEIPVEDVRAPRRALPRSPAATAPRGFIFVQDAEIEFDVADSTINDWAADSANNLRPDKERSTGRKYVHLATLKALLKKKRPDKG